VHREHNTGRPIPKVSIGMPVYDSEGFVREALDSLLAQTFADFELIISDDGSTDRTEDICRGYAAKDRRIRYIRHPEHKGMAANFNFLLREARGEYFMWAAHDDRWDREFIATLLGPLISDEECTTAFCPYVYTDESGKVISPARVCDYSGRSTIVRLLRMCWYYDDACFYGLHRRQSIQDARVPVWWWINSQCPANNNYPVLFYLLSVGDYISVGSSPLWFNRLMRQPPYLTSPYAGRPHLAYSAFGLRKLNVLCESLRSIYLGTSAATTALLIVPVLLARFALDNAQYLAPRARAGLGIALRSLRSRS